jgi:hypothetical protein
MDESPDGSIPRELFSEYEGRPFLCCTRCGERLQDFPQGYKVSKAVRNGEVTFEYALCFPCLEAMVNDSSVESRQRMAAFQEERLRPGTVGMEACAFCGCSRAEAEKGDHVLVGACQSQTLLASHLICGSCLEDMSDLASEATRRGWRRFVDENFPGCPPDLEPEPTDRPLAPLLQS